MKAMPQFLLDFPWPQSSSSRVWSLALCARSNSTSALAQLSIHARRCQQGLCMFPAGGLVAGLVTAEGGRKGRLSEDETLDLESEARGFLSPAFDLALPMIDGSFLLSQPAPELRDV